MDKPQPSPINFGISVSESLIQTLEKLGDSGPAIDLIKQRTAFGIKKYGQPLMSEDGRNTIIDALQEAGDLMQYIWKAKLRHEDLSQVSQILATIQKIMTIDPH